MPRNATGADETYTIDWHRRLHHRSRADTPDAEVPSYAVLQSRVAGRLEGWKRSLPALAGSDLRNLSNDGLFSNIYHSTLKLASDAAISRCQSGQSPPTPIGPAFEQGVARRVHSWLEATNHPAIHSAWRKVKVAERRESHRATAEFDILLVLKNGVLWHLECKSFIAANKDLDARLYNLQQAGSQLARMAPCGPLFSGHAGEEWFQSQHDRRRQMEARRHISFIPFTLPGQAETYCIEEGGIARRSRVQGWRTLLSGARVYRPGSP